MRLLYIHNINQVAQMYSSELTRRGHVVTLYEPDMTASDAALPLKLAAMPKRILDMRQVIGKLNQDYFDVVHIHWASYGILDLMSKLPTVVHCHGDDVRKRLEHPVFRPLLTAILHRAAAVACITPDLLPIVQTVRPDACFLPAPIDTDQFVPNQEIQEERMRTILLFARLDPNKGVDIAFQGIERFVQHHPDVRVRVLNWGMLRNQYKQQYGNCFEFIPLVAPAAVPHLISTADVIIGQFALGALGLSELQAMSCAKPVIASFRYDDAYPLPPPLCQATTGEEVADHLEYLFQHPDVATTVGQRGREWVSRYHDYRVVTSNLEALYQFITNKQQVIETENDLNVSCK